jgi:hypothetical protein
MPFRDNPDHWRERAAQMRALAVDSKDAEAAKLMLKVADDYDKLADRVERRLRPLPLQKKVKPPGDQQPA